MPTTATYIVTDAQKALLASKAKELGISNSELIRALIASLNNPNWRLLVAPAKVSYNVIEPEILEAAHNMGEGGRKFLAETLAPVACPNCGQIDGHQDFCSERIPL